jgi:hypothetical protein
LTRLSSLSFVDFLLDFCFNNVGGLNLTKAG